MTIEDVIAELAVTTPYSAASLQAAVDAMRRRAAEERRELRPEWLPALLRAAVDLRIAGVPSGEALIAALPALRDQP
jgi:hypothetical protein